MCVTLSCFILTQGNYIVPLSDKGWIRLKY